MVHDDLPAEPDPMKRLLVLLGAAAVLVTGCGAKTDTAHLAAAKLLPEAAPKAFPLLPDTNTVVGGWKPWGQPEDIPNYPIQLNVTALPSGPSAVGNGVVDDYPAFTNALALVATSNAILVPNGTYKLSLPLQFTYLKQTALRGQSRSNTWLVNYTTNSSVDRGAISFGAQDT